MREPPVLQIHQQKCEVIEDVDAGERLRELQAVEQGGPAVDEADVAKMQIAVATAHLAGRAAPVEQSRNCRQPFAPFLEQFVYVLRHETGLPRCREAVMLRLRYV